MSALTIPSVFKAVDKMTAPLRKMTKGVRSFAQKSQAGVARLNRGLNKLTPSLGGVGRQLLAFASAAVIFQQVGAAVEVVKDFEQANSNLSAVMNTTSKNQKLLGSDAERLGSITAKSATEVVGLQEAFARLGFETPQIINMTEATIAGSIAMNAELAATAELTGAVVKTFSDFGSVDAPDILDKMTLATQKSALNFEKLQTALPIVGGAANAAGVSFEQTLSLLGKLSDAGIDASSSANALKRIFIESKKGGLDYGQILTKISKESDKLTTSVDEFGVRAAVSSAVLSEKLTETAKLTNDLSDATIFQGAAQKAAAERLDTFEGSLTLFSSAYEGLLIKMNKGTGALSIFRKLVEFATKNIEGIAITIGVLIGGFIALKAIVLAYNVVMAAYSIGVGIAAAINGTLTLSVGKNAIALTAFKIATGAAAAATWLWSAAQTALNFIMSMNPIGLMIIAIAALVALVAVIIAKWDQWGAALSIFLGPLGLVISLVMSFRRNWDMVSKAFSEGGMIEGIKEIGRVILDAILAPVQQLLELISNIPGLDIADTGAQQIEDFRRSLGVDVSGEEKPALNSKKAEQDGLSNSFEKISQSTLGINISDPGNNAEIEQGGDALPVNLTTTTGFGI